MANRFWVGGSAAWDGTAGTKWSTTSGGAGGAAVPTSADDVFLDAASGAVTVTKNVGSALRSLNCTGFTGTLANTNGTTTVGDGTAGAGNVALLLVAGMTYSGGGAFTFQATHGTAQTIDCGGKTLGAVQFGLNNNSTISSVYTLTGHFATSSTMTMNQCTFNAVTFNVNCASTFNPNTALLTINFGTGTWTIGGTWSAVSTYTHNCGTSTVVMTRASANLSSTGKTFYNVTFTGGGTSNIAAANTFTNLTFTGTASVSGGATIVGNQTVTGTFTATGNSTANRLAITSSAVGTARIITAAAVALTNCDFADIDAAGTSTPWTGTSLGDLGGNSDITFDAPVTRYAVAAGNWGTTATWATTSGGAAGASIPLPQDTAIFDAASPAGTYNVNMPRVGHIDCTGFTRTLQLIVSCTCYGSVTLSAAMTFSGGVTFTVGGRGNYTITSNGKSFPAGFNHNFPTGTYTLQDALTTPQAFGGSGGTFNTNGFTVTAQTAGINGGTLAANGSTFVLTATTSLIVWTAVAGATITGSPNITIGTTSVQPRYISGGGKTYGALTYTLAGSTGELLMSGVTNNSFDTINFSDANNARSLQFVAATTTTIRTRFNVFGTAGKLMTVTSTTAAVHFLVGPISAWMSCDYLSVSQSSAATPPVLYAAVVTPPGSGLVTTPSITPSPNCLLIAVLGTRTGTPSVVSTTLAGVGSWTSGASATMGIMTITIFYAQVTGSPGTGTITFQLGNTGATGAIAHVMEMHAAAFVQGKGGTATSATPSITLDALPTAGNMVLGGIMYDTGFSAAPGAQFTELAETAGNRGGQTQYDRTNPATTVDWTMSGGVPAVPMAAVEFSGFMRAWFAGGNSTNGGNNRGWIFTAMAAQEAFIEAEGVVDSLENVLDAVVLDAEGLTDATAAGLGLDVLDTEGLLDDVSAGVGPTIIDVQDLTDEVIGSLAALTTDDEGLVDEVSTGIGPGITDGEGLVDSSSMVLEASIADDLDGTDTTSTDLATLVATDSLGLTDTASAGAGAVFDEELGLVDDQAMVLDADITDSLPAVDTTGMDTSAVIDTDELGLVDRPIVGILYDAETCAHADIEDAEVEAGIELALVEAEIVDALIESDVEDC